MTTTVGDFLLQRLVAWGVHRVYGYPGDGINGIMGAFGRAKSDIEFVQTRHEELAEFMTCGHRCAAVNACCCLPCAMRRMTH